MDDNLVIENLHSLEELHKHIEVYINTLKNVDKGSELKNLIANDFKNLTNFYIMVGNHANKPISLPQDTYLLNYVISETFKDLLILHRDVFLELHKVEIYNAEKQISNTQIDNHFFQSKSILESALDTFSKSTIHESKMLNKDAKTIQKISRKLSLHTNPWDIYKEQYKTLLQQINDITKTNSALIKTSKTFEALEKVIKKVTKNHNELVDKTMQVVQFISKSIDEKGDLLSYVDEHLQKHYSAENNHQLFTDAVNNEINQLSRIEVPIAFHEGQLSVRNIDFNKRTQKWFDYKILPDLMDLIGIETNLLNKHSLNLINLKNSFQLFKKHNKEEDFNVIVNSLAHLLDEMRNLKNKGEIITKAMRAKIKEELLVSNLLKGLPFLEVPINSSLSIEGNTILKNVKESLRKRSSYFNSKYQKSVNYESLSNLELSAECIAYRMFQDENSHYDSLFLSKKFIGDLFLVARKDQELKLEQIINQWQNGFNKSVLVVGDRLSGRSTFIDYTTKKFFRKDIVTLQPNTDATIDGRKFSTTFNLKEALNYVKNNNIKSTKPVIIIDDLELWRDKSYSLLTNIRALVEFIETESDEAFVITTTTSQMQAHLDQRFDFSNRFTNIINCSKADKNEIASAIQVRHGAAHRNLITEDIEVMSNHKMQMIANKLCKQKHNNFGDTLQSWTYQTFVQENENVLFKESYYEFLDFFTQQERIVLKQALIFKKVSEFSLKNVIANAYDTNFKSSLRRLINTKILLRDIDGNLYINPVVVNDVSRILNTN